MIFSLFVILIACTALILIVMTAPSVKIKGKDIPVLYWYAPLLGALILLLTGKLPLENLMAGLFSGDAINPIKILILFISMTMMSIFLDEVGFFEYLAGVVLEKAGGSQKVLFGCLYLMVSVLTVFTSNDIIILTFTPFICHFAKRAKIDPLPYLFAEFVAANTWSMALMIGNPTNVYLATASGITFLEYAKTMVLPTLTGGVVAFVMLFIIFRRKLASKIEAVPREGEIKDRGGLVIGLIHLGLCTITLVVSSYVDLQMWLISFGYCLSLFIVVLIYRSVQKKRPTALIMCLKRAPWELIPFVISMFVFVLTLKEFEVTTNLASLLGDKNVVFKYGMASFLAANIINNIPMSVFFSAIIENLPEVVRGDAVYAAIIGSNLGALFTPIGALAGIMWSNILKRHNVKFSFLTFVKYGAMISIPTILAVLAVANL